MFPSYSLSFSLPHYDSKLHIVVIVIFLCLGLNRFFFFNYFQFYLLERPNNINMLFYFRLVIITHFFFHNHNHLNLFHEPKYDRENEQFAYSLLSVSLFFSFFPSVFRCWFVLVFFFSPSLLHFFLVLFVSRSSLKCCILFPILSSAVSLIV